MPGENFIVVPEVHVHPLTGAGARELRIFFDELDNLWVQRPDVTTERKGRIIWSYLTEPVRRELRTQELDANSRRTKSSRA